MIDLNLIAGPYEKQQALAAMVRRLRKMKKLSRRALAEKSGVPEPTIRRFEMTGEISLRQFLILYSKFLPFTELDQFVANSLSQAQLEVAKQPKTIAEVLASE